MLGGALGGAFHVRIFGKPLTAVSPSLRSCLTASRCIADRSLHGPAPSPRLSCFTYGRLGAAIARSSPSETSGKVNLARGGRR